VTVFVPQIKMHEITVLLVFSSVFILLIGWQEGHEARKNVPLIPKDSVLEQMEDDRYHLSLMNPRDALHHGKRAANKGGRW